jgi:hypothetical protein
MPTIFAGADATSKAYRAGRRRYAPGAVPRLALLPVALAVCAACAAQANGPMVYVPSVHGGSPAAHAAPPGEDRLTACALPWSLETMAEDPGSVIVTCPGDVRREPVKAGPITRAIDPALEPARRRVCDCAEKMAAPAFVDLKVTSAPDDGVASVEADVIDDELEQDSAKAFYACVGTLKVSYPRAHVDTCGGANPTFVYPLHVDLAK